MAISRSGDKRCVGQTLLGSPFIQSERQRPGTSPFLIRRAISDQLRLPAPAHLTACSQPCLTVAKHEAQVPAHIEEGWSQARWALAQQCDVTVAL